MTAVIDKEQEATDETAAEATATAAYSNRTEFSLRDVPWGKLGATIDGGAVSAVEAAKAGGLDFEVDLLEAGFKSTTKPAVGKSAWATVGSRRAVVRRDTSQFFSFVSADYKPVQYSEAFSFMDSINPRYVAAGALGGGRQAFMVVEFPGEENLDLGLDDPMKLYVVLRTSHDLTRAIEVSVLTLRGSCMNALTLPSFSRAAQQRWSVRHIGDPMQKLMQAQRVVAGTEAYAHDLAETAQRLAAYDLEIEEAERVLKMVLPDRPKREEQVNAIIGAWQHSNTIGFSDNGWGLTNAVSEYFEWGRNEGTRTAQSRFTGGLTGATHRYTGRTANLLLRRTRNAA